MADEKSDIEPVMEAAVVPSSYWLDACEEEDDIVPCELIGDFPADFENGGEIADNFFGGIDHILDSIKSGAGLPANVDGDSMEILQVEDVSVMNGVGVEVAHVGVECKMEVDSPNGVSLGVQCNGRKDGSDNGKMNGEMKEEGDRERDSEGTDGKRRRLSDGYRDERGYLSRCPTYGRNRENNGRKRYRESEENGRRDRDRDRDRDRNWDRDRNRERDLSSRRVDYHNGRREGRDREWRDREAKGYWERERPGSKEIVYRVGSYEVEKNRDGNKSELEKNQECNGRAATNEGNFKERNLEEQARHYQLEVLEQAKQRNTIAFLETGAGKTLIAVLLMKSICEKLQPQNKKMVAIFLVPKVPLVYQQAEVIREQTGYNVGHYCGEMGQDFWDTRRWQREFDTKQVSYIIEVSMCKSLLVF